MKRQMKWVALILLLVYSVTLCGCGLLDNFIRYTLKIDIQGEGEVTPPSGSKYKKGTVVELKATPQEGWKFKEWAGPNGSEVTSDKITMNGDKSITAIFGKEKDNLGNEEQPGEPGITPISDDYYGYTDNACWQYSVTGLEDGNIVDYTFVQKVKEVFDPQAPPKTRIFKVEFLSFPGEEDPIESYLARVETNEGIINYYNITSHEFVGEDIIVIGYDFGYIQEQNLLHVAPLKVGHETPMGKVESCKEVDLPIGRMEAFKVHEIYSIPIIDERVLTREAEVWIVPYIGIVRANEKWTEKGIETDKTEAKLISYTIN